MEDGNWQRAQTLPVQSAVPARRMPRSLSDNDLCPRSSLDEASMEDFSLLHSQVPRVESTWQNALLCAVSLLTGCLMPALADHSRTATLYGPEGIKIERRLPYRASSVIMAEAAINVMIGVVAILCRSGSCLFSRAQHLQMLPLTLVYCLGDVAALSAIGSGGGLLYLTVINSRLLFAAAASKVLLNRRLTQREWALFAVITVSIVLFAAQRGSHDASREGAAIGCSLALLKALLGAVAAVLTESRYRSLDIWEANTLLKMQTFMVALVFAQLGQFFLEDIANCPQGDLSKLTEKCIDRRGWDSWTWVVVIAEVGNGWLSVAILTRVSVLSHRAPEVFCCF